MDSRTTKDFFADLEDFDTAMLVTRDGANLRSRPMAPHIVSRDNTIRFITARSTHKVDEVAKAPEANLVFTDDDDTWISVSGRIRISDAPADIDEIWTSGAEAWLEKPQAVVIVFEPQMAEYWENDTNFVKAGWEMAKGVLTGEKPDIGEHRKLSL